MASEKYPIWFRKAGIPYVKQYSSIDSIVYQNAKKTNVNVPSQRVLTETAKIFVWTSNGYSFPASPIKQDFIKWNDQS